MTSSPSQSPVPITLEADLTVSDTGLEGSTSLSAGGASKEGTLEDEATASSSTNAQETPKNSDNANESNDSREVSKSVENDDGQNAASTDAASVGEARTNPWQAIFSPEYNAYYFYNSQTHETTWQNPLIKPTEASDDQTQAAVSTPGEESQGQVAEGSQGSNHLAALHAAALAQGIDPALAHLDPSLLSAVAGPSTAPVGQGHPAAFTAKFNARTGAFTRPDARDPTHLGEYERMKRMSGFYFDVDAWETQRENEAAAEAAAAEEGGRKRKRPTKKDLDRFKEQKRLKKIAKTAWLRT